MAEWAWMGEKRNLGLIKHEAQPHRIQSRGSHENKSRRNSQNSWEERQTLEQIDLVQFLLCYFLERLSILEILMIMCLNTIKK